MAGVEKNRVTVWACLFLALTTLLLYLPATRNGFVNLDDNQYILDNPHVTAGLTTPGLAWAFRFTGYAGNWHPLTWISHMLDCEVYGLNAGGHHLTNVLFHVVNSLLVLLLFRQMTGSVWRSAFVAALFAWHPLHVESVAWASERKDVLSTFFWLLTLVAYVKYVHERKAFVSRLQTETTPAPNIQRRGQPMVFYVLALFLFALGLMSKPMLVTLPFALLLLDFWPLGRTSTTLPPEEKPSFLSLPWGWLVLEKAPFFLLSAVASVITYRIQRQGGAVSTLDEVSLPRRAANAVVAYLQYVLNTVWPSKLAAIYPYPRHQSALLVLAGVLFLFAFTALFILAAKRRPYLFVGWFWFLGTLVPTIGLVQVGLQALADRYAYIPSLGLFALVVWGLGDFLGACTSPAAGRLLATSAGIVALAGCIICTSLQIGTWHNSETLYRHAIAETRDNYVAYNGLGDALTATNKTEALACYMKAVEINPRYPEGQYNLGTTLLDQGRLDDAITHLNLALKRDPTLAAAHNNLGKALMLQGKLDDADDQFAQATVIKPDYAQAYYNLGTLLLRQSRPERAVPELSQATRLQPDYADAYGNLGVAYLDLGRMADGITQLAKAVQLQPTNAGTRSNLGLALLNDNQPADAATQFSEALRLTPNDPQAQFNLALALDRGHQTKDAIAHYRAALGLKPEFVEALNNLAWILATGSKADLRDGREAVQLAQKACELTNYKEPGRILTLAAASAEAGDFPGATAMAQKARDVAAAKADQETAAKAGKLLAVYQAGLTFRETP